MLCTLKPMRAVVFNRRQKTRKNLNSWSAISQVTLNKLALLVTPWPSITENPKTAGGIKETSLILTHAAPRRLSLFVRPNGSTKLLVHLSLGGRAKERQDAE